MTQIQMKKEEQVLLETITSISLQQVSNKEIMIGTKSIRFHLLLLITDQMEVAGQRSRVRESVSVATDCSHVYYNINR
jgi:hypothetical protein